MKCTICGKSIKEKNAKYLDGEVFGRECWKKAVELKRQNGLERWKLENWQRTLIFVEMLKMKNTSRIKSQFKLDFLKSIIEQFTVKGFITKKQKLMIIGDGQENKFGFTNDGWLNNKDWDNLDSLAKNTSFDVKIGWGNFFKKD